MTEDEAKDTARRAYTRNSRLSSANIGKAIGRSRQTVDSYIADLRAATQMGMGIKIFRMNHLGIPHDRIAMRLGVNQASIHNHLLKMPVLAKSINADLSRGSKWRATEKMFSFHKKNKYIRKINRWFTTASGYILGDSHFYPSSFYNQGSSFSIFRSD